MFKKILFAVLVAAPMMLSAQSLKFGSLNPSEIMNVMPDVATAQNTLKAASDKYQAQAKTLQDEYNKKLTELDALEKAKSNTDAKVKEIQDLQVRMQNFQQQASTDLQKQQETLMAPIQQKLMNAIQSVGAKGGYAGIYDAGMMLYRGTQIEDVTAKVKAELGIK